MKLLLTQLRNYGLPSLKNLILPRTLTGKKQELPVKKLLLGQPLEKVVNKDAMANPASLDWYVEFAKQRADKQ